MSIVNCVQIQRSVDVESMKLGCTNYQLLWYYKILHLLCFLCLEMHFFFISFLKQIHVTLLFDARLVSYRLQNADPLQYRLLLHRCSVCWICSQQQSLHLLGFFAIFLRGIYSRIISRKLFSLMGLTQVCLGLSFSLQTCTKAGQTPELPISEPTAKREFAAL